MMPTTQQRCQRCGAAEIFSTTVLDPRTSVLVHIIHCAACGHQQWNVPTSETAR